MKKNHINGVIIVEGSHDVMKVSSLYESCFVMTNGYDLPEKEKAFIKALPTNTLIIALLDNDDAGEKIRNKVNELRNDIVNVKVDAPKSSKKKGIAECDVNDIRNALDKYISNKENNNQIDLYKLGLTGKENSSYLRELISNQFNLGLVNSNNLLTRLNLLGIKEEDIKKAIVHE